MYSKLYGGCISQPRAAGNTVTRTYSLHESASLFSSRATNSALRRRPRCALSCRIAWRTRRIQPAAAPTRSKKLYHAYTKLINKHIRLLSDIRCGTQPGEPVVVYKTVHVRLHSTMTGQGRGIRCCSRGQELGEAPELSKLHL